MSDQPDLSTLPQRMRYAAQVLKDAAAEFHSRSENTNSGWVVRHWPTNDLLSYAHQWEGADREKSEREELVDELARFLFNQVYETRTWPSADYCIATDFRRRAHELIESGWRKGDPE